MKKLLLFFCILSISIGYSKAEVLTGKCGNKLTYSLDTETGVLTITGSGAMYDYNYGNNPWYDKKSSVKSIQLPEGLTTIGYNAFPGCSSLTSVTIPNSVTTIGGGAFENCSSLSSVNIGNRVTTIGVFAFENCTALSSITIPNSVAEIHFGAFGNCTALSSITIPNSVTKIGGNAFSGCTSLTSVTIPNSVTEIHFGAFGNCTALSSITIPNSVTKINGPNSYGDVDVGAFENCSSLTSVTLGNSVTTIGTRAFSGCSSLPSVSIPNSVTAIGDMAFYGCSSLTSVTIPNSVTYISMGAFAACSSLASVSIPNNVTAIGDMAFYGCSSLTSVNIGNSVTTIGGSAFSDCSKLTSITCEAITPPTVGNEAFYNVNDKVVLYVPFITGEQYKKADGWKDFKDIRYHYKKCTGICGDNLQFSFDQEELVLKITGSGDMYDYESGKAPWYGACSYIKSIELPAELTTIGTYAFEGCSSLTSITIPNSVTTIGAYAFSGCTEITKITCEATTPPTIKATTFAGVSKDYAVLYVPYKSVESYKQASGWRGFYDIRYIEDATAKSGANVSVPKVTADGATVEWKYVSEANTYVLEIKQDGKVIITLIFNESGQLLSINFNTSASAPARKAPALPKFANGTTNGWQYTINGLEPNTTYTYTVTAKKDEKVLETKSIEFTTTGTATAVENVLDSSAGGAKKILHNGQIYILTPDGKKYTPTGAAL